MSAKKLVVVACLLLVAIGVPAAYFLGTMHRNALNGSGSNNVIGTVDGQKIYEKDLTVSERQSLFDANSQLYLSAENILAKRYLQKIIADYKKQNNIDDDSAAQQAYIKANIKVPENQVQDFIQQNADNPQLKGKSLEQQKALVEPYLMQQAVQAFLDNLIQKATSEGKLNVMLVEKPNPEKADIQINADDPSLGPKDAPVTIVEFADFQCPYCNAALPTVKEILQKYDGKVRFVFKNYPLVQIHDNAVDAAIAAKCAQEQNKYWEMQDQLFANDKNLSDDLYTKLAKQLELDEAKFKACQQNPDVRANIMNEMQYGQTLGISATPAFYINGTLIMGAQPVSVFERIIDEELAKH